MKYYQFIPIAVYFVIFACGMMVEALKECPDTASINPSIPTAAEMHRLDNDLIMYCPSDAIRILQRSLVGEGYPVQVDGVMGQETYNAAIEWQREMK